MTELQPTWTEGAPWTESGVWWSTSRRQVTGSKPNSVCNRNCGPGCVHNCLSWPGTSPASAPFPHIARIRRSLGAVVVAGCFGWRWLVRPASGAVPSVRSVVLPSRSVAAPRPGVALGATKPFLWPSFMACLLALSFPPRQEQVLTAQHRKDGWAQNPLLWLCPAGHAGHASPSWPAGQSQRWHCHALS